MRGLPGLQGENNEELLFNEVRASVWHKKKTILELNHGDGCTTLYIYLIPLNYTLKCHVTQPLPQNQSITQPENL